MIRALRPARPLIWIAVLLVLVGGIYPLVRFLLTPLLPALAPPQAVSSLGGDGLGAAAVINTARVGVETGLAVTLPGLLAGLLLERRTWRGGPWLAASLWALFLTPSYLLTTGWQILMSQPPLRRGPVHALFFSEAGIVMLLALKGLPFAALTARAGWAAVGGELSGAARVHVPSARRRALIVGRLLAPSAAAAFAVVFVEAITDFGVAATLGAQLHLPLVIYAVYSRLSRLPVNFIQAAQLSLVLIILAGAAVAVQQWCLRAGAPTVGGRSRPAPRERLRLMEAAGAALLLSLVAFAAVAVPALALLGQAAFADPSAALSGQDLASLGYSACYAFVAAGLSLTLAVALLSGGTARLSGQAVNALTLGAMAVPGVVLGAAYVIAFNGALPLYGSPLLLLAAYVATHLPVLMRFLEGPLRSGHQGLTDAARLHGLEHGARIERVHAPLLLRPLLWGWAIAFGSVFFELPLSALLHPAARAPVGVQLLQLDETLRFSTEARLALAGGVVCLAIVGLVTGLLPRWLTAPARRGEAVS